MKKSKKHPFEIRRFAMNHLQFSGSKDTELEKAVGRFLREKGSKHKVQVVARDGYVNLVGWAADPGEKRRIAELVESVPGVRMVTNHIRIEPWVEKRGLIHF
jgi:osmotically-inducible protein OsmY